MVLIKLITCILNYLIILLSNIKISAQGVIKNTNKVYLVTFNASDANNTNKNLNLSLESL